MNPIALALALDDYADVVLSDEEMERIAENAYKKLGIKYELFANESGRPSTYRPFFQDDFDRAKSQLVATEKRYLRRDGKNYEVKKNVLDYVSQNARELMIYALEEIYAGSKDEGSANLLVESAFYLAEVKAKRKSKRSLMKGLRISVR